ncbi:hypothetical protein [Clostridium perfringens]|uniref:hypothetical protein n=1 Tax=Clostridium perfringens TaxID=1502 RepID=UPI001B81EAD3|nr:hypothetical protein [Clostridium perfringens]HBC2032849.1 hypothetical protein [Clostridium perfringens]HBC2055078.1 hypothetical protein [Clostridium perfringens]HBC2069802.1 hypothetical protein [Clostridium perfringens]
MVLVIIIAAIILLLVVSAYKEYKDRILVEELPRVIKEMINQGKKISILNKEMIYTPEEEEFLTNGLEIAWAYEGDKSYRKLLRKYKELEKILNKKRFDRMMKGLAGEERIKRELKKSLKEKIDDIKVNYSEIYYKCFKNEDEANEYIERLVKKF